MNHTVHMMKRLAVAALMLATAACAPEPLLSGQAHPPMWEARRGDVRIILIGSVHQLPPQLDWQDERVRRAIDASDQLWLELAPDDLELVPDLFRRMAEDEAVPPLDRRIGGDRALWVEDMASAKGLSREDANAMESWALALIVGDQGADDAGLSRAHGVENVLTGHFARAGKPVRGLERPIDQLSVFDSLMPAVQDRMLAAAADGSSRDRIRRLLTAWAAGDAATLAAIADADLARVPGLADTLVTARNRAWLARIVESAPPDGTLMIAVGSGHLLGPNGLPALLSTAGYDVSPLRPARRP